jgi:hypothetical protein
MAQGEVPLQSPLWIACFVILSVAKNLARMIVQSRFIAALRPTNIRQTRPKACNLIELNYFTSWMIAVQSRWGERRPIRELLTLGVDAINAGNCPHRRLLSLGLARGSVPNDCVAG